MRLFKIISYIDLEFWLIIDMVWFKQMGLIKKIRLVSKFLTSQPGSQTIAIPSYKTELRIMTPKFYFFNFLS